MYMWVNSYLSAWKCYWPQRAVVANLFTVLPFVTRYIKCMQEFERCACMAIYAYDVVLDLKDNFDSHRDNINLISLYLLTELYFKIGNPVLIKTRKVILATTAVTQLGPLPLSYPGWYPRPSHWFSWYLIV